MRKEIPGYEEIYAVDKNGFVWSLRRAPHKGKVLKPYINTGGYLRVNLHKDKKVEHKYVHRLVAEAFLPNPEKLAVVNHKDANPKNNCADNLEWCDQRYNIHFSRALGNQNGIPVRAIHRTTGERRNFCNLKVAGEELFGKWWALRYHQQKKGRRFSIGDWDFEVTTGEIHTA